MKTELVTAGGRRDEILAFSEYSTLFCAHTNHSFCQNGVKEKVWVKGDRMEIDRGLLLGLGQRALKEKRRR